jgi:hypothetical protein
MVEGLSDVPVAPQIARIHGLAGAPGVGYDETRPRVLPPNAGLRVLIFDVRLHRAEDVAALVEWLDRRRAIVARASQRRLRVYLPEDSPLVLDIPALKEVASCSQVVVGVGSID